jgi:glycosyltransferase involved in cell wall biosynthesis
MAKQATLKPIPLPDYDIYRSYLQKAYSKAFPLKQIPFYPGGNLIQIPAPVNVQKTGWPWTVESAIKFTDKDNCPKISVVIPSYQQGPFIEEAIRSVLLQNYPNVELIVMDGGSNDDTVKVLNHYKDFISMAVMEQDRGQSHAINKGFSIAGGELFYWLNSDDYLNRNSLNYIIPFFIKDAALDIIYGDGLLLDDATGSLKIEHAPLVLERYLRFGGVILSHSIVWRKRVHCPVWEDLSCAMDAELWLRLFPGRKSKHIPVPVGTSRKHASQKTTHTNWIKRWQDDYELYIWEYYTPINKFTWRYRLYEYRIIQKLYRLLLKLKPFRLKIE